MKKRFKVEALYKEAKQTNVALLPVNTNFEWWEEYENNSSIYDRYILDTFRNFYYWVVFNNSTPAEALADFKEALVSFLTINQKRYAELYRLHVLPDNAYDIVNNYSVTENSTRTIVEGERSDIQATTIGAHSDTESSTLGAHNDTENTTLGAHSDTENTTIGSRTDSTSNSTGARSDTSEEEISAFNSSAYQDSNKTSNNIGAQTSSGSVTSGSQTNSASTSFGAQSNSVSTSFGAQSNSVSTSFGAQSNSETLSKGEQENTDTYELTRAGNIGVQTPADVIGGHLDLWDRFNFYKQIFDEIAKNYFVCQNRHR